MTRLYQLAKRAPRDNEALLEIIKLFEPKIAKSLYLTNQSSREELSQELMLKLVESIRKYDMHNIPGFWEFRDMIYSEEAMLNKDLN